MSNGVHALVIFDAMSVPAKYHDKIQTFIHDHLQGEVLMSWAYGNFSNPTITDWVDLGRCQGTSTRLIYTPKPLDKSEVYTDVYSIILDTMDIFRTIPKLNTFILVSNNPDLISLVVKLRERGHSTIVFGYKDCHTGLRISPRNFYHVNTDTSLQSV